MYCNLGKARVLLDEGKAILKYRNPFTIQLLYGSSGYKQPVHHLTSMTIRKTGGDAPDNLLTLYEACHQAYHQGLIDIVGKRMRKSNKGAAFMGIMRKTLISRLRQQLQIPVVETKGYITKLTKEKLLFLLKGHTNDALASA